MFKSLFIMLLFMSSAFAKGNLPNHFDSERPDIKRALKSKGFEFTVNHSLKKDCKDGNKLSCAILKYRKNKTRKNAKKVSHILRKFPCRVSQMNNCVEHLYARVYMEKHRAALKLARKMCRHQHEASCRQLAHYRAIGRLGLREEFKN